MVSREYFDDVASQWDAMRQRFFSDSVRERALCAAGAESPGLAADIGAGTGFITEALLAKGLSVIAVDQSPEMLAEMLAKFGAGLPVEYRLGVADRLPIDDGEVDYAFANMYLHHVEEPLQAILEMRRILKPGGRLVITDMDQHEHRFLVREHHDRWMGFARSDVQLWFEQAGMQDIALDSVGENCSTSSSIGEQASVSIFLALGRK